jgi:hypothetical protein
MRDWYSGALQPKLAQAVAEGRADAGRAVELHRAMTRLFEGERRDRPDVERIMDADRCVDRV